MGTGVVGDWVGGGVGDFDGCPVVGTGVGTGVVGRVGGDVGGSVGCPVVGTGVGAGVMLSHAVHVPSALLPPLMQLSNTVCRLVQSPKPSNPAPNAFAASQ